MDQKCRNIGIQIKRKTALQKEITEAVKKEVFRYKKYQSLIKLYAQGDDLQVG